ncbi:MAG: endolytic transglycosylase MltG [Roseburia sp.]|nr:endolytic transglycosylase MltG [Ruminococcus sp.]MCM1153750.1 endolytic transglycosylase MltG [Roseburia sp.]MCM1243392.1 endolytic transglycosylase MltG [Roseburia sp.]
MDIKQLAASAIETIIKIVAVFFLVRFVWGAAVQAYDYGYRVFAETPVSVGDGRTISISVEIDDSAKDVGENLEEKGLIRDANLFVLQAILSERYNKINPGIYDLNTSMDPDEMLEILTADYVEEEEEEKASSDNVPIETGE